MSYAEKIHKYTVTTKIGDHENSRTSYTGTYPQLKQHVTAVGKRWHSTFGFPLVVTFDQVA